MPLVTARMPIFEIVQAVAILTLALIGLGGKRHSLYSTSVTELLFLKFITEFSCSNHVENVSFSFRKIENDPKTT